MAFDAMLIIYGSLSKSISLKIALAGTVLSVLFFHLVMFILINFEF